MRAGSILLWCLAGPVIFLLVIVATSVVIGAGGTPPERIGAEVAAQVSLMLLATLSLLGLLVLWRLDLSRLWVWPKGARAGDVVWGLGTGLALAALYFTAIAPVMALLQARVGDYVPPGETLAALTTQALPFVLANVVLAPVVEETVYRGELLGRMRERTGSAVAIALSCLAFGLLHWPGGIWYMLATGVFAGGAFAALAVLRGGLVAPFVAHLLLNLVETIVALG